MLTLNQNLVSIDSASTRDIDDAISVAKTPDGWRVLVAIAAPGMLVPIGSDADTAARELAATVYARTSVVKSMLPRQISEDEATLKAGSSRPAMLIDIQLSEALNVLETTICISEVVVSEQLTYESIPSYAGEKSVIGDMLKDAIALSKGLLAKRRSSGALAFFDLSRLVYLDEDGQIRTAASTGDMIGHIVVQEFMILANTMTARWALERDIPFLYRTHRPKLATPPTEELLETIQMWTIDPSSGDESTMQEQLRVIAGSASYSAKAHGHYALNLPHYAHCTSPLRRYVDLANQRQIIAAAAGAVCPYTQEDLTQLADELNATLAKIKLDRKAHFKGAVIDNASRAIESGRLDRMGDPELVQSIKLSAQIAKFPPELAQHLADKMLAQALADKVLDALVEASAQCALPEPILMAFAKMLVDAPQKSKHLLMFALQTGMATGHEVEERQSHGSTFCITVRLIRKADGEQISARASATRKRDAENMASARAVCSYLGAFAYLPPEDSPEVAAAPATQTSQAAVSASTAGIRRNSKGELLEWCQKRKIPAPIFDIKPSGPHNAMRFSCAVIMPIKGEIWEGRSENSPTKKEAESSAAADLLNMLNQLP